jgi:hypothetical protein
MVKPIDDDDEAKLVHVSLGFETTPVAVISDNGVSGGDGGHLLHMAPVGSESI